MGWTTITKEQIKSVPVGSKIKVGNAITTLVDHYDGGDCGFNMSPKIKMNNRNFAVRIFSDSDWKRCPTIEVWKETDKEECLNLFAAIKAFEEKHNITIKDWGENKDNNNIPETIPLGQIMKVGNGQWEEIVMLVQVEARKYNLMCLLSGNRLLAKLEITRQDGGVFSTKEIENKSGYEIIELLENPFRD